MHPGPGAWTLLGNQLLIVWKACYDSTWPKYIATASEVVVVVCAGQFVMFFPREPHRPGCKYGDSEGTVTKLMFKVKSTVWKQSS